MPEYDLGTARGRIEIDGSGAARGVDEVNAATGKMQMTQEQAASTLQTTGLAMVGMGGAALAGFGVAVKASADFEKGISAIAAVSDATEGEIEKLREKALQLGADTAYSASESAMAMEELVKAGLTVDDVLNGAADATVNLAAAGGVDLPNAAAIAANAMNQFNLSASDMPKIADLIAGAANASAIDVNDFGMSMAQAGATANLVGLQFDDMALAITAMGNAGIKGSDAGTSLKTMLANLQPGTKKQTELFQELGLMQEELVTDANKMGNAFFDANGKIKSMSEIAGLLEGALAGMSEQQKAATLETLFGSDAIRAAAVISGEGAAGMDKLAESMGKVSAEDVAEKRMDNLAGSIEKLKGSIETALISAGSPFQNVLKTIVDGLAGLVNLFGSLPAPVQTFLTSLLALSGAALVLAGSGSFVLGTFLKFGTTLRDMKAALGVVRQVGLLSKAMGVLNAVMALNPAILIVGAIIALGAALYLLYTKSETFRKFVDGLWQGIQRVWDQILDFVKTIPAKFQAGVDAIKDVIGKAIDWIKRNWDLLLPIFLGPLGAIILVIRRWGDDIVNFFKSIPDRIVNGLRNLWNGVVAVFSDFPDNIIGIIEKGINKVIDLFTGIPGKIGDAVQGVGSGIADFFGDLFGDSDKKVKEQGDEVARTAAESGQGIANAMQARLTNIERSGYEMTQAALRPFNDIISELRSRGDYRDGKWFLGDVVVGYSKNGQEDGDIVLSGVRNITDQLKKVADYDGKYWKIGDVVVGYSDYEDSDIIITDLEAVQTKVGDVGGTIRAVTEKAKSDLNNMVPDKPAKDAESVGDRIKGALGGVGGFLLEKVVTPISNFDFGATFAGIATGIVSFFQGLPGRIGGFVSSSVQIIAALFGKLPGLIGNFIGGAVDTITGPLGKLPGLAGRAFGSLVDTATTFLSELPGRIGYFLGLVIGSVVRFVSDITRGGGEAGSGFVASIYEWITGLPGRIAGFLIAIIQNVIGWGAEFISNAVRIASSVFTSIVNWLQQLPGRVFGFFQNMLQTIVTLAPQIISAAFRIGADVLNSIVAFISQLPGAAMNFIGRLPGMIGSFVSNAASSAARIGIGVYNGIVGFITNIPSAIGGLISRGIDMIKNAVGRATRAARDFGSGLWNGFKDGMGINSPSFIEKAMTTMVKNVAADTVNLKRHIGEVQGLSRGIPTSAKQMGRATAASGGVVAAQAARSGFGNGAATAPSATVGTGVTVQGPLVAVDRMEVRNDQDIYKISRGLAERITAEQHALGKRVVSSNA